MNNINILFLSLLDFDSLDERNIYTDLLRSFKCAGHHLYVISPVERRKQKDTYVVYEENTTILKLRIGNTQKTNLLEKGISTLLIEPQFISGIKQHFSDVHFDLVLYSTPPVTFAKVIAFVKKRDCAKSYLLLKDIFPQNAVDIGMMSKAGLKSFLYRYFRDKEKKLYAISDKIGCMSEANKNYVLTHNPEISPDKVEICPNSIEISDERLSPAQKAWARQQYNIPQDCTVFIYGGNLGKPQDIPFVVECLKANANMADRFFVICGTGTEYAKLKAYMDNAQPSNVLLINGLPKAEYENFVGCCDVGLIFLDHRFTIPNFPSRLLSYMQKGMPVLACTDKNTDIGKVITQGNFGWWCESIDTAAFTRQVEEALCSNLSVLGNNAFAYLQKHYTADRGYQTIINLI